MTVKDVAAGLSTTATFFTSALGSGVLSFAAQYPRSCTGELLEGTYSCTNVFGATTMSAADAGLWSTVLGFVIGGLALTIRSAITED